MEGVYVPLTTPFSATGLDEEALLANLESYEAFPLSGYLTTGSSAESPLLSEPEKRKILELVRSHTDRIVMAGVMHESSYHCLDLIREVADLGADAALVRTPSYFGSQYDLVEYYQRLADRSPLPIVLYQIPQYTGVKLTSDQVRALAGHPRIIGIKDSSADLVCLQENLDPSFAYLVGSGALLLPALMLGGAGGILALATVLPGPCCELVRFFREGELEQARRLQTRLVPVNRILGASQGLGLAGLKKALDVRGFRGGPVRHPLKDLPASSEERLRRLLQDWSGQPHRDREGP